MSGSKALVRHCRAAVGQNPSATALKATTRSGHSPIGLEYLRPSTQRDFCVKKLWLPPRIAIRKLKPYLSYLYLVVFFIVGYHYQPIATVGFAILFALILIFLGLQIYFMPVKAKLESIAKLKARHGIPLDQPHKVDMILKSGYFRVP
jgi:hypothetical protein